MPLESAFERLLDQQSFDLRSRQYTRFMDQKVTPDVLAAIAGYIGLYFAPGEQFTRPELTSRQDFETELATIFRKPPTSVAPNENDKFAGQNMKVLAYSGILSERRRGRSLIYSVSSPDVLEELAFRERIAFQFISTYVEKVLRDTGQFGMFEQYRASAQTGEDYDVLRDRFIHFARAHMGLGRRGSTSTLEARRIFPKVLNPLAVKWGIRGSVMGRVSSYPLSMADLTYNRTNVRDINLPRGQSVNLSRADRVSEIRKQRDDRNQYLIAQAKKEVRQRHNSQSEMGGLYAQGPAHQVHHIFPESTHPSLAAVRENLILLTAHQHNSLAHPENRTHLVNEEYQVQLLRAKLESVIESAAVQDNFYNLASFVGVLEEGYGCRLPDPRTSVETIRRFLQDRL